jgi:CheY-like chemotaxis protein
MSKTSVLLVDDRIGDITWLIDLLESYSSSIDLVSNEVDARERFSRFEKGSVFYRLAIVDIMVSVKSVMDLVQLDESFYAESSKTGLRLCSYAREELGICKKALPIVCISARADDEDIRQELERLGVPLYSRVPQSSEDDLGGYIDAFFSG